MSESYDRCEAERIKMNIIDSLPIPFETESEIDIGMSDISAKNQETTHQINNNKPSSTHNHDLEMISLFSPTYVSCLEKFSGEIYKKKIEERLENEENSSLINLECIKKSKQYFLKESNIDIPESLKRQIKNFKYLPKILNNENHKTMEPHKKATLMRHDNNAYFKDVKPNLSQWNKLNEMNQKCSTWLNKCESSKINKVRFTTGSTGIK